MKRQQRDPKPSPRGKPLPTRYKLEDERPGFTRKVVVYTERYDADGRIEYDEKGYPRIYEVEVYFTVGEYDDGTPGEVYIIMGKEGEETGGWANSWATSISFLLQYGIDPRHIIQKFKGVDFVPCGMTNCPQVPICKSIPDLIVRYIEWKYFSQHEDNEDGYASVLDAAVGESDKKE